MSKKAKPPVTADPNPTLAADILTEFSALASRMAAANDRAAVLTNAKERAVLERLNVDDDGETLRPDPDISDRGALLAQQRARLATTGGDGVTGAATLPTVPVYLAVDGFTGQTLGTSVRSWAAAMRDAERPAAWAENAVAGQEYAGVVLRMGAL